MAETVPKTASQITLSQFLGVDFANEETEVDLRRSPYAPNMVADAAGRPEVRTGYKTLETFKGERINGLHWHEGTLLVHAGTSLYRQEADGTYTRISNALADERSTSFYIDGGTYFLDGQTYQVYKGGVLIPVVGYIPTTIIGAAPAGGGTTLESVNMLTGWQIQSFTGDGTSKVYNLNATAVANETPEVKIGGVSQTTGWTFDAAAKTVTFTTAPADGAGVDNVTIKFKAANDERAKIDGCTIWASYGLGNDSRFFVSGNEAYKNIDWQSGLYDPTYFPDTGYTKIGGENSRIMGYIKQYDSLLIVKEQMELETGIFMRTAEIDAEGIAYFPVKEGLQGVGAVSKYAFANAQSDQVFFSRDGVFGLDTNAITNQRSLQLRSWYINPELVKETNMQEAVSAVWGRSYILAINGKMYVANLELTNQNQTGSYGYEWYTWTDIPARVLAEYEGRLYIGTEDGDIRILKSLEEDKLYAFSDDGRGIEAIWTTPLMDGGHFMREKTVLGKGTGILAKPFTRTSGEIFLTTDKNYMKETRDFRLFVFDFNDVDFNAFTFLIRDNPRVVISPKKFRKVLQFQMGVRHTEANRGLGVLKMMVGFTTGNLTRKK